MDAWISEAARVFQAAEGGKTIWNDEHADCTEIPSIRDRLMRALESSLPDSSRQET